MISKCDKITSVFYILSSDSNWLELVRIGRALWAECLVIAFGHKIYAAITFLKACPDVL